MHYEKMLTAQIFVQCLNVSIRFSGHRNKNCQFYKCVIK